MSDPFVGEIRMFAGNFAPNGFALCDGQLLAISQNNALFALLGTIYGGDGATTFALPDLRGRIAIHQGQAPGLSNRPIGLRSGQETVAVTATQLPSHTHAVQAAGNATETRPQGNALAGASFDAYSTTPGTKAMAAAAVSSVGGSQSHTNLQPTQCINYIIALFGVFPS